MTLFIFLCYLYLMVDVLVSFQLTIIFSTAILHDELISICLFGVLVNVCKVLMYISMCLYDALACMLYKVLLLTNNESM